MRLERDLVPDRLAGELDRLLRERLRIGPAPAAPVELMQHRTSPVPVLWRGCGAAKAHTKGNVPRCTQVRDVARSHLVIESRTRSCTGIDSPERSRQAGKK